MMAQEYGKKLDTSLMSIRDKLKMLEYQDCTCGIDKQVYEELWEVLHSMYRYYNDMRQAVVLDKRPTFGNCLLPTMSVQTYTYGIRDSIYTLSFNTSY